MPDLQLQRWRWTPDARLARTADGAVIVNYGSSFRHAVGLTEADGLAKISGITSSFKWPANLSESLRDSLAQSRTIVLEEDFERYQALIMQRLSAALARSYGLIVMPTERCNFRCTYCYESFEKGRMSEDNIVALERYIDNVAPTAPQFSLGFFGGEPLLCADIITRLSERAFRHISARGLPYAASIATNGYLLTESTFKSLIDVGVVSYQITVDGPRELHDQQRVMGNGKGTFDRIVANLRHMAQSSEQFVCMVRCNLPADRMQAATALFDSELAFLRNDARFAVDLQTVWSSDRVTVGPSDSACAQSVAKGVDFYLLNRQLEQAGIRTAAYSVTPSTLSTACYAGKRNWYVVGPDLALYKCTVVFDNPLNQVGRIAADGALVLNEERAELWSGSNALTDASCIGCHYRVPCGGIACPLSRFVSGVKACPDGKEVSTLRRWASALPAAANSTAPAAHPAKKHEVIYLRPVAAAQPKQRGVSYELMER